MEAERLLYMFAMILPAFGLARLVWERKLEVSRKAVTGTNAFSSTVLGGIVGTGALWKLTGSYIYAAVYAAIIVVSGKSGIEVGAQKAWDICEKYKIPRMVFVTEMDDDNASFRQVVEDLQEMYGKKIAPFHLPIRENEKFVGYVNVVAQTGNRWNDKGEVVESEIPD